MRKLTDSLEQKVSRGIPPGYLNSQGKLPGGDTSQILVKGREQRIPQEREKQCRDPVKNVRRLRRGGVQAELDTTGHSETRGRRARLQGSYGCVEEKGARRERTRSGGHCLA